MRSKPHAARARSDVTNITPSRAGRKSHPWSRFAQTLARLAPDFDAEAFAVTLAAVKAHEGDGLPIWLNVFGPPSNGKTATLDTLPSSPIPDTRHTARDGAIISIDSLTPRTLISGLASGGVKRPGLLERVSSCVLLVKDLSQQLSSEGQREVFAQLRRVYDGAQSLTFGSGKTFSWAGRVTMICASVRHVGAFDTELGARFLCVTSRRSEFAEEFQEGRAELRRAVGILLRDTPAPKVTESDTERVRPLAEALAVMRAHVPRDDFRREVIDSPIIEAPHRLTHQLAALLASLRALRCESSDAAYLSVLRVVCDSIPATRRVILGSVARRGCATVGDLTEDLIANTGSKPSTVMVRRAVEDLSTLILIDELADDGASTEAVALELKGRPPKRYLPASRWAILEGVPGFLDALKADLFSGRRGG